MKKTSEERSDNRITSAQGGIVNFYRRHIANSGIEGWEKERNEG